MESVTHPPQKGLAVGVQFLIAGPMGCMPAEMEKGFHMANMRDQMEALTQGIATAAHERQMAVGYSKLQTARMLQAFSRERAAMARALTSGLVADREARSVNVGTMRTDTGAMREKFRREHVRTQRAVRRGLAESTEAVTSLVASLRADFAKRRADARKAHRHMVEAQRAGLAKDRRDRCREVSELMNDFHASRGEMAQELAESLAKSTQNVRSHVSGLNEWHRTSLQKSREQALVSRQIPSYLLTAQGGGEAPAPFSALGREPEEHQKKRRAKKTTVAKAARASVGKPGKPKKR